MHRLIRLACRKLGLQPKKTRFILGNGRPPADPKGGASTVPWDSRRRRRRVVDRSWVRGQSARRGPVATWCSWIEDRLLRVSVVPTEDEKGPDGLVARSLPLLRSPKPGAPSFISIPKRGHLRTGSSHSFAVPLLAFTPSRCSSFPAVRARIEFGILVPLFCF